MSASVSGSLGLRLRARGRRAACERHEAGAANPGFFTDETLTRFGGTVGGQPFVVNVDSLTGYIADPILRETHDIVGFLRPA